MPPTSETHKLAEEITQALIKTCSDHKISLTKLFDLLEEINPERIKDYNHPIKKALAEILDNHEDLYNGWREAMCMVRLNVQHKITAENDKTFLRKILKIIHI